MNGAGMTSRVVSWRFIHQPQMFGTDTHGDGIADFDRSDLDGQGDGRAAVQLYRHAFELANALEEVANGVAFLMSDESSYITGFNLEITGGQ